MSSATLSKIETILKSEYDDTFIRKVLNHFIIYRLEEYIYPSAVSADLNITIQESYLLLNAISKTRIIDTRYFALCPYCGNNTRIAETIRELYEQCYCEECEKEFDVFDYSQVIYKVISE
ncbi:MAG: hypothetical protein ACI4KB_02440 [Oscillospiraceae bacterium]